MNLAVAFSNCAEKNAAKTAVFYGEREISYTELQSQSLTIAAHLQNSFGVKPGDRVALWLKNCPEFVASVFGILQTGAVVVPVNNFLKPAEVNYILADGGIDVLISDAELSAHFPELSAARPQLKIFKVEDFSSETANHKSPIANCERGEKDLAVIIYTSGTTGKPKGVMLSHGNLLHNVNSCRIVLESVPDDCFAVILPMFHTYMMTVGIFLPFTMGGSIVLVKSLHPPRAMFQEIFSRRATILTAVPTFYRMLLGAQVPTPMPIRIFISGSAPLPMQTLTEFEEKFKVPLIEGYGLSKASPVVSKNPLHGVRKAGSIGIPVANVEMSIQDNDGKTLGANETGEICVRGSLLQFERDLAMMTGKKALVIDQRFNPGGGIDQELLQILQQRQYQYTRTRDSVQVARPLRGFFGPMVVMANERSTSDAEVFPDGFKTLKLGKVVGVTTYGAVIGTGSYRLMDGSTIRTPTIGLWNVNNTNLENYGVPPDVYVDNTPDDFLKGRDAQIEKAVETLKEELAKKK